jgi:hypothetical protein
MNGQRWTGFLENRHGRSVGAEYHRSHFGPGQALGHDRSRSGTDALGGAIFRSDRGELPLLGLKSPDRGEFVAQCFDAVALASQLDCDVTHPAEGPDERRIRWAEVAERAGVPMHGSIGFADIAAALDPDGSDVDEREIGNLHWESLAALCELLARHTATPQTCWFGVWDGNHWLQAAFATTVFTEGAGEAGESGRPVPPATEPSQPKLSWSDPSPPLPLVGGVRRPFSQPDLARRPRLVRCQRHRPAKHVHRRVPRRRRRPARAVPERVAAPGTATATAALPLGRR